MTRADVMKKFSNESESSLQDEASTGNPGAMFILKARNGWQETAPAQNPTLINGKVKSLDEIAADYGLNFADKRAIESK
jgi:hypothetical protein